MRRRDFFKYTSAGIVLPYALNGFLIKALGGTAAMNKLSATQNNRVLVLVQLSGGNDGLNTVIPLDQYSKYYNARPNIALLENKVLKLNKGEAALHPAMGAIHKLYNEGKAGIIQSVGYPKPSFSHFRSTDIWMTASDSAEIVNTGWAGRYFGKLNTKPLDDIEEQLTEPLAIQIGSSVSTAFQGLGISDALAISDPKNFYKFISGQTDARRDTNWGEKLQYVEQVAQQSSLYAGTVKAAALKVTKQSDKYPAKNALADQLKVVARLIAGGLGTRIYMVSTGGFDTHFRQTDVKDTTQGLHASLLQRVSEAIEGFMHDLKFLSIQNKVMGITFSEFGRRINSNASQGTDHGTAAPLFYFGHSVNSSILGSNPFIPQKVDVKDNLAMQHDFRSVYGTILQKWLGLNRKDVNEILLGEFPILQFI